MNSVESRTNTVLPCLPADSSDCDSNNVPFIQLANTSNTNTNNNNNSNNTNTNTNNINISENTNNNLKRKLADHSNNNYPDDLIIINDDLFSDNGFDSHIDHCIICNEGGSLICCDSCCLAFHLSCISLKSVPDLWFCKLCDNNMNKNNNNSTILLHNIQDLRNYYQIIQEAIQSVHQHKQSIRLQNQQVYRNSHSNNHSNKVIPQRIIMTRRMRAFFEPVPSDEIIQNTIQTEVDPKDQQNSHVNTTTSSNHAIINNNDANTSNRTAEMKAEVASIYSSFETHKQIIDSNTLQCAFCKKYENEISDGSFLTERESLIGPYYDSERKISHFVHKSCAIWSPRVYINKQNKGHYRYMNIIQEIDRSRWLICSCCNKRGGSIGCSVENCGKTYHYFCALQSNCHFLKKQFKILCPNHSIKHNFNRMLHLNYTNTNLLQSLTSTNRVLDRFYNNSADLYTNTVLNKYKRLKLVQKKLQSREYMIQLLNKNGNISIEPNKFIRKNEEKKLKKLMTRITVKQYENNNSHNNGTTDILGIDKIFENNIGGLNKAIETIRECILFPLFYPELYSTFHIQPIKGILLHGKSGTGKTLLAKTLANYCSYCMNNNNNNNDNNATRATITFYSLKGSDLLSKFYGEAESQLRLLFERAKTTAPSIIYFDEIDSLIPTRNSRQNQVHSSIVTTLLALMDGIDNSNSNNNNLVFVLGSTNRIDSIDPALRRPGRFDREIYFPLPSKEDRTRIMSIYTKKWIYSNRTNITMEQFNTIAREQCTNFSGADINNLCSEALIRAINRQTDRLSKDNKTWTNETDTKMDSENNTNSLNTSKPSVTIELCDFQSALAKVQSSTVRVSQNNELYPLSSISPVNFYESELNRCINQVIQNSQCFTSQFSRLLVHGEAKYIPNRFCSLLIQEKALEHGVMYNLGITNIITLSSSINCSSIEYLSNQFHSMKYNQLNILYFPNFELYYDGSTVNYNLRICLINLLKGIINSPQNQYIVLISLNTVYSSLFRYSLKIEKYFQQLFDYQHQFELTR